MARVQNGGNDVLAKVILGIGVLLVLRQEFLEDAPFEDVDAHRGVVGLRLFGLLLELIDRAVGVRVHNAEAGGLLNGNLPHGDGHVGVALLVEANHPGIVHPVDMVAGEDQHVVRIIARNKGKVLIDGVGGSLVPLRFLGAGVGREHLHAAVGAVQAPGLSVADIFIQFQRLILGEDSDGVNSGVDAVRQREVDDAILAPEGDGRLGGILRQHQKTAALTTGQQHGDAALFLKSHSVRISFIRYSIFAAVDLGFRFALLRL